MTSSLRAGIRLAFLLLFVVIALPIATVCVLCGQIFCSRGRFKVVMAATPIFCGTVAWLMGLRVKIVGKRDNAAAVYVGNHVSYTDILLAGRACAGVFVSRHDVKDWPVIGLFARLAGTVFLDRGSLRSAMASSDGLIERASTGTRIIVFPEGRTSSGETVHDFKPFLFNAITASSYSVQPFAIRYTHVGSLPVSDANREIVHWFDPAPSFSSHAWRLMGCPSARVTLTFLPTLPPPGVAGKEPAREYAERLRQAVANSLLDPPR